MKCPNCGSRIADNAAQCNTCGTVFGNVQEEQPCSDLKPKSKTLAWILMLFGLGDLYLLDFKKFIIKEIVVNILTCSIGALIWSIVDTVRILNGTINCDAKGAPLK